MTHTRRAVGVGLILLLAAAGLSTLILATDKGLLGKGTARSVVADFEDASGIRWKTRVQISGIDVGQVAEIALVEGDDKGPLVARVRLEVLDKYTLYSNARLRKVPDSLLGDFRLEIDPGTSDHPPLPPGGKIADVMGRSDLDTIQQKLREVSSDVAEITGALAGVLGGTSGQKTIATTVGDVQRLLQTWAQVGATAQQTVASQQEALAAIVDHIEGLSRVLYESVDKGPIHNFQDNAAQISQDLREVVKEVRWLVAGSQAGAAGDISSKPQGGVGQTVAALRGASQNLETALGKVASGEGSVGRLINNPNAALSLEETLADAGELVGGVARLQTSVELRSEYNIPFPGADRVSGGVKSTVGVRIQPKPDKYYLIEAIADPRGSQSRKITTVGAGDDAVSVEETETDFNAFRFSAQFAKRYGFATLRFGILENTGGIGLDLYALGDKLQLRTDAFDFDRRDTISNASLLPRLRGIASYAFYPHLFVHAGIDDPLNARMRTWFVGGGLRFGDDDLRSLLLIAPSPG